MPSFRNEILNSPTDFHHRTQSSLRRVPVEKDFHLPATDAEREALFAEMRPLLNRLMRRYATTPEMRQDFPGECYYQFRRLLDLYEPERRIPLRAYLVHQLTLCLYSFSRTEWRYAVRHHMLAEDQLALLSYYPEAEWHNEIFIRQTREALPTALANLTSRQRDVIVWRYFESCTYEEIASRLEIKTSTARSLARHGLRHLRTSLQDLPVFAS